MWSAQRHLVPLAPAARLIVIAWSRRRRICGPNQVSAESGSGPAISPPAGGGDAASWARADSALCSADKSSCGRR